MAFGTAVATHVIVVVALAAYHLTVIPPPRLSLNAAFVPAEKYEIIEVLRPKLQVTSTSLARQTVRIEQPRKPSLALGGAMGRVSSPSIPTFVENSLSAADLMGTLPAGDGEGTGDEGKGVDQSGGDTYSVPFQDLVAGMREDGLDVVLVFDSTGSMDEEVNVVKQRMLQIGGALIKGIPGTRIGICTYRDYGERYVANGIVMTDDIKVVHRYLLGIRTDGGGDTPEAVHEGLYWAMTNNRFRPDARKVILLFGDAPPRPRELPKSLLLAKTFHEKHGGIVSTISCGRRTLPEFHMIAQAGGGDSFTLRNHQQLMEELLIFVFGAQHRQEVIRFFGLQPTRQPVRGSRR